MSHSSVSTEPASAGPERPTADVSARGGEKHRDIVAPVVALVVGMLVGMFIGVCIGNAARKRMDRWSFRYL